MRRIFFRFVAGFVSVQSFIFGKVKNPVTTSDLTRLDRDHAQLNSLSRNL